MQMRENSKYNNVELNTWLEILIREHLPRKRARLEIQREQRRKRQGQEVVDLAKA